MNATANRFSGRPVLKSDEVDTDADAPKTENLVKAVEEKFATDFETLDETAKSLTDQLEAVKGDKAESDKLTGKLEELDETVKSLKAKHDKEIVEATIQDMGTTVKSLRDVIAAAREPHSDFSLGGIASEESKDESPYGPDAEHSFFVDASKSFKNDPEASERWQNAMTEKAMTQASGSTGGYLVPPVVLSELLTIREQSNILRPLMSRIQVNSDTVRIAAQTSGLLAGWVAELAEKPESELSFGEVSVNNFWKAGMAVVSNQLLRNSNPSIDSLIYSDLGKRLAALEEIAFISGSGVGQPLGILHTPGVQYTGDPNAANHGGTVGTLFTSTDVDDLLDEIVNGIAAIHTEYFGTPNGILMHPRTWARIVKARATDAYLVGPPSHAQGGGRDYTDPLPGYGNGPAGSPQGSLFGINVYTTRNVPINAGAADDESRVIIGNWNEGLILDHAQVTLDSSEHVYFTTNQTIFRAEDAVGFTAARYPKAFYVIGGPGLAGG